MLLIDYLPQGQIINVEYYSSLLVQFKDFKLVISSKFPYRNFICVSVLYDCHLLLLVILTFHGEYELQTYTL